jgi:hypothetical protein
MKNPKRPRDPNQLAKSIVDIAIGEKVEETVIENKNVHAVELGRLGGLKGGVARALVLTASQRSKIARIAAKKRWNK